MNKCLHKPAYKNVEYEWYFYKMIENRIEEEFTNKLDKYSRETSSLTSKSLIILLSSRGYKTEVNYFK